MKINSNKLKNITDYKDFTITINIKLLKELAKIAFLLFLVGFIARISASYEPWLPPPIPTMIILTLVTSICILKFYPIFLRFYFLVPIVISLVSGLTGAMSAYYMIHGVEIIIQTWRWLFYFTIVNIIISVVICNIYVKKKKKKHEEIT